MKQTLRRNNCSQGFSDWSCAVLSVPFTALIIFNAQFWLELKSSAIWNGWDSNALGKTSACRICVRAWDFYFEYFAIRAPNTNDLLRHYLPERLILRTWRYFCSKRTTSSKDLAIPNTCVHFVSWGDGLEFSSLSCVTGWMVQMGVLPVVFCLLRRRPTLRGVRRSSYLLFLRYFSMTTS